MLCAARSVPEPGCARGPDPGRLGSLAEVVRTYVRDHRDRAQRERRYYAVQRSLADVVRIAALSKIPGGKRHPHQRRIPGAVLRQAADAFDAALSASAGGFLDLRSFDDLHESVRAVIGPIHGVGKLMVYDVATRIGAHLGLEPELIYLHAGTRDGARALGLRGTIIRKSDLPKAFQALSPGEIEDCLCIYKTALQRLTASD